MSNLAENAFASVHATIEPHAAFICDGPRDSSLYFLGPEIVAALAWLAVNVVTPVFVGVATSYASDGLKAKERAEREKATRAISVTEADLEAIRAEIAETLARVDTGKFPSEDVVRQARARLADLLTTNGFPEKFAARDADSIVRSLLSQLYGHSRR